jgi:hypothetical protein
LPDSEARISKNGWLFQQKAGIKMSEAINYEAVLADIDARIAKLQATREGIVDLMALTGTVPTGGPGGKIAHDAFLAMSIPDATKKYLSMTRQKKDTQSIIDALEQGGLTRSAYSTVYAVLRRREKQIGDIINIKGDWALAEWHPNLRKGKTTNDSEPELEEETMEEVAEHAEKIDKAISEARTKTA